MKKNVLFLAVIFNMFFVVGCDNKKNANTDWLVSATDEVMVEISQKEYDSLIHRTKVLEAENKELGEDIQYSIRENEEFISMLRENPQQYCLLILDAELSAAEKGKGCYGSFSDFFVPTIHDAKNAGVPIPEIQKRIDRLNELANKNIFISSFHYQLFADGGNDAVIKYIWGE